MYLEAADGKEKDSPCPWGASIPVVLDAATASVSAGQSRALEEEEMRGVVRTWSYIVRAGGKPRITYSERKGVAGGCCTEARHLLLGDDAAVLRVHSGGDWEVFGAWLPGLYHLEL